MTTCPVCDEEFNKNSHNQLFCCQKCMDLARHRRKKNLPLNNQEYKKFKIRERSCPVCSLFFSPISVASSLQKYCSNRCKQLSTLRKARGVPINHEDPKQKQCAVCLKIFNVKRSYSHQKYCSRKCGGLAYARRIRNFPEALGNGICAVCGKEYKKRRANNHSYCGHKCKKLAVSRKFYGKPVFGPLKFKRGEGSLSNSGYRTLTRHGHPNSSKRGQILEHIYVMSNHLGRPLHKHESVHHKNGIRDDNRIDNLELSIVIVTGKQIGRAHV